MSYPFFYCIYLSFRATPSYTTETHFAGLTNYAVVLHDSVFLNSLVITVIWTAGSTVSRTSCSGMGAAVLVNQLTLVPRTDPRRADATLYRWLRDRELRLALAVPGRIWVAQSAPDVAGTSSSQPVSLLSSLTWALPAVILVNIWKTAPFAMIMFLAGPSRRS